MSFAIDRHLGLCLRECRITLGIAVTDLAENIGATSQEVENLESGAAKFDRRTLLNLSGALNIPVVALLGGKKGELVSVIFSRHDYLTATLICHIAADIRKLEKSHLMRILCGPPLFGAE